MVSTAQFVTVSQLNILVRMDSFCSCLQSIQQLRRMSAVKQLLDHLLSPTPPLSQRIQLLTTQIKTLSLPTLQQFMRELSFILYRKQPECHSQLMVLQLIKRILITGSLPLYLLANVYIFPWMVSVNALHRDRTINKRAELMYRDAVGPHQQIKAEKVQSYRQLLQFVGEFVVFFGENLKFHPYSKYKIKHSLAKQLVDGSYSRSLEYFIEKDVRTLQSNLKAYNTQFRQDLKQLTQFLSQTVEQCLTNPPKYQDTSYLLLSLIEMSERYQNIYQSYCITAIIYRTCSYLTPGYVLTACQFLHSVISLGEIESIQIVNSKCLPLVLGFLLPIDFRSGRVLSKVQHELDHITLERLIDYYYIWYDKTKIVGLSTKIYEYSYSMVNSLKRPSKLAYQSELKQFYSRLAQMKSNNEIKRAFVIDQNQEIQNFTVKLLRDAEFCIRSNNRQQIAYQNVLDQLTLTEKSSEYMSQFSESLVRSAHEREEARAGDNYRQNKLKGPPHKKFGRRESSISEAKQKSLRRPGNRQSVLSKKSDRLSSQNIYYTRDSPKILTTAAVPRIKQQVFTSVPYYLEKQRLEQSEKQAWQASARTVHAKNSTPQKTPVSSPQQSMFLNSSQYSQKENNLKKNEISSIYLNEKKGEESQSGEFLHFEKDSIARSQDKGQVEEPLIVKSIDSDIQFNDTVKLHNSRSQELIEYGMDKAAKLPASLKKPQFGFKHVDTNDSSLILKDISMSWKESPKKDSGKEKEQQIRTPQQNSNAIIRRLKDSSPEEMVLQKRTENTKAPARSEDYKSPTKQSEKDNIKSIYLDRQVADSSNSEIKELSGQPYAESESGSYQSSKVPSNFGSFFKRSQKKQKASSLHSSKSLRRIRIPERPVYIPDFKKMRDLQNQLGKLKQQTQNYQKLLAAKSKQKQVLQTKKQQLVAQDPYFLKRQNQIIKTMLQKKSQEKPLVSSRSSAQNLARELKESSVKNYTINLKEYNPDILKIKLQNIEGYSKNIKKNIVANRCLILKNDMVEIGYSFKDKVVTLYFTLKHHCDSLDINLVGNSIVYSEDIKRQFDKIFVGKQIKFKTSVNGTKDENFFIHSTIELKTSYQEKLQKKVEQFKVELPLAPYNIATPLQADQLSSMSQSKQPSTHYITPLYSSCQDLIKKGKSYLQYLFPHGCFDQQSSTFSLSYLWKGRRQDIKIKMKQRAFRVVGVGNPVESGRQLIENIINMLIAPQNSQ